MNSFKLTLLFATGLAACSSAAAQSDDAAGNARQLEARGAAADARETLATAVKSAPGNVALHAAWADFLDRHGDPEARKAYEDLYALQAKTGTERQFSARRLAVLDLLAGDRTAAEKHLTWYKTAGGSPLALPEAGAAHSDLFTTVEIPGPLRSFSRMAALSPDLPRQEVLPSLARNIVTNGYQAANSSEGLDQTEYLKLVIRYLSQARELTKLAGEKNIIDVETCESKVTGELLRVLGYRMRGGCGAEVVLETVNASRAFLTIDSGFPLAELEQALRTNRPFHYDYSASVVPILYTPEYWLGSKEKIKGEFIDSFLGDPQLCRLYLGVSKLDRETAQQMKASISVLRLKAFSHVLDFFGGMFAIRDGHAIVPGGARSEAAWADLAGASPSNPGAFFDKLMAKDDGWLASYFDSLSRISGPVQEYLTQPDRLKRFYGAVKGKITSPGPARPVFRANTDLLLLTTRLRLDADGKPHVPGNLEIWKQLFIKHPHGKYDGKLTRAAANWKDPDDILEALFALCRKAVENEPLKIYMALSDLDRRRDKPLQPATVDRMAREFHLFGSQYALLNESRGLSDATILSYLDTAAGVSGIRDQGVRSDAAGTLQGLAGLWQIMVRSGSLPEKEADAAMNAILAPFAKVRNNREIFDAGMTGVRALLKSTGTAPDANIHDRMIDLLAGTGKVEDNDSHTQLVQDIIRVLEAQRLVSLKSLADLSDHLEALGKGAKLDPAIIQRVSGRLSEVQLPRAGLSGVEKNALLFGYWSERHIEFQRKLNLRAQVEKAGADAAKLSDVRGLLAPLLRDTLVGLNYAHYAPPGAQITYTNPIFVRSHDFLGIQGSNQTWKQTEVSGSGWPASSGGRLVGSLAGLPYALAEAEQNFLIPSREQALIWGDLVPQMVQSAKIPRFWSVTPRQMHWVGLHLRLADSLLANAMLDPDLRTRVVEILERHAPPARARLVGRLLANGDLAGALENVTPSESFLLAREMAAGDKLDPLARELVALGRDHASEVNYEEISKYFGTPKPTLTNSYQPELLFIRTFPTLMGYSSRIMAESWESSNLYYAAIADEAYMTPAQLNVVVPEWTRATVEKIFATHLEDWPALLRSLRNVGADVRNRNQHAEAAAGGQ